MVSNFGPELFSQADNAHLEALKALEALMEIQPETPQTVEQLLRQIREAEAYLMLLSYDLVQQGGSYSKTEIAIVGHSLSAVTALQERLAMERRHI